MKLFKRNTSEEQRADAEHDEAVNNRMKNVLNRETNHDDASAVE